MELQAPQSFSFKSGDSLRLALAVVDEDGEPADISGMTVRFVAARRVGAEAALTTEGGSANAVATITSGPGGTIEITAEGDDTDALSGTYAYECELEDGAGDKETIAHGFLTFEPNLI